MTKPKKKPDMMGGANFLGRLIHWCLKWGCDFSLRNTAYNHPTMDVTRDYWARGEDHEIQSDGCLLDMSHSMRYVKCLIPEVVFTKGDRHIRIQASSLDDLYLRVEREHKRIYMELSVPMMGEE